MATIYQNRKDGKIVSFKFKTFLGRDENGKQQFKCKTWIPDKQMTESKLISLAEKESIIWEREVLTKQEKAFKVDYLCTNFYINLSHPKGRLGRCRSNT